MCEKFLLKKVRYIDQGTIFLKEKESDLNFFFSGRDLQYGIVKSLF